MTATGFPRRTFAAKGLDAQSSAFLRAPGTEALYSGVEIKTASALAISRLQSRDGQGLRRRLEILVEGRRSARPRQKTNSTSAGHSAAAASSSAPL